MQAILNRSLMAAICMGSLIVSTQSWADVSKMVNETETQAAVKMQMQCSIKPCNAQSEAKKPNNELAKQQHEHSPEMVQKVQSSGVDLAHVMMKMDHSKMTMPVTTPSK